MPDVFHPIPSHQHVMRFVFVLVTKNVDPTHKKKSNTMEQVRLGRGNDEVKYQWTYSFTWKFPSLNTKNISSSPNAPNPMLVDMILYQLLWRNLDPIYELKKIYLFNLVFHWNKSHLKIESQVSFMKESNTLNLVKGCKVLVSRSVFLLMILALFWERRKIEVLMKSHQRGICPCFKNK